MGDNGNIKKLQINPDLFKVTGGTRKKKAATDENKPLRMKTTASATSHNKTSKERKLLRYIREQQEKTYKKLFEEETGSRKSSNVDAVIDDILEKPKTDVEESLAYLKNIVQEHENENKEKHNMTVKNHSHINTDYYKRQLSPNSPAIPASIVQPTVSPVYGQNMMNTIYVPPSNMLQPPVELSQRYHVPVQPKYGCLKNGNLPTYRQTMRNTPAITMNAPITPSSVINTTNVSYPAPVMTPPVISTPQSPLSINTFNMDSNKLAARRNEELKRRSENMQLKQFMENNNAMKQTQYMRQKRTLRRTYYTGKSKKLPKVTVLVSNKTIRKNVAEKAQKLRQTPMHDVKRYLMKNGLIKSGTTAPNDVLRKMYESAMMIGGEVHNHNSENLLHNYLYGDKE
jgi:hypothetical protein